MTTSRVFAAVIALLVLAALTRCFAGGGDEPLDTSGYQVSARSQCRDLVKNRLGQAEFRSETTSQTTQADGSTDYIVRGKADTILGAYTFQCDATIEAVDGLPMTIKLTKLQF